MSKVSESLPQLEKLSLEEQQELVDNLQLHLRFELYQQLKTQFTKELELYKEQFKQEQIVKIKNSFQNDFQQILATSKEHMQRTYEENLHQTVE